MKAAIAIGIAILAIVVFFIANRKTKAKTEAEEFEAIGKATSRPAEKND